MPNTAKVRSPVIAARKQSTRDAKRMLRDIVDKETKLYWQNVKAWPTPRFRVELVPPKNGSRQNQPKFEYSGEGEADDPSELDEADQVRQREGLRHVTIKEDASWISDEKINPSRRATTNGANDSIRSQDLPKGNPDFLAEELTTHPHLSIKPSIRKQPSYPSARESSTIRKRREKIKIQENEMINNQLDAWLEQDRWNIFRCLCDFYVTVLLLIVGHMIVGFSSESYYQTSSVQDVMENTVFNDMTLSTISTTGHLYQYIQSVVIPFCYLNPTTQLPFSAEAETDVLQDISDITWSGTWTNTSGWPDHEEVSQMSQNGLWLMGGMKLRALRYKRKKCDHDPHNTFGKVCTEVASYYGTATHIVDKEPWQVGDITIPFLDTSESGMEPFFQSKTASWFYGEGHVIDFPVRNKTMTYKAANQLFTYLFLNGYFDVQIRFFTLDFRFYNPSTSQHTFARIAAEFDASSVFPSTHFHSWAFHDASNYTICVTVLISFALLFFLMDHVSELWLYCIWRGECFCRKTIRKRLWKIRERRAAESQNQGFLRVPSMMDGTYADCFRCRSRTHRCFFCCCVVGEPFLGRCKAGVEVTKGKFLEFRDEEPVPLKKEVAFNNGHIYQYIPKEMKYLRHVPCDERIIPKGTQIEFTFYGLTDVYLFVLKPVEWLGDRFQGPVTSTKLRRLSRFYQTLQKDHWEKFKGKTPRVVTTKDNIEREVVVYRRTFTSYCNAEPPTQVVDDLPVPGLNEVDETGLAPGLTPGAPPTMFSDPSNQLSYQVQGTVYTNLNIPQVTEKEGIIGQLPLDLEMGIAVGWSSVNQSHWSCFCCDTFCGSGCVKYYMNFWNIIDFLFVVCLITFFVFHQIIVWDVDEKSFLDITNTESLRRMDFFAQATVYSCGICVFMAFLKFIKYSTIFQRSLSWFDSMIREAMKTLAGFFVICAFFLFAFTFMGWFFFHANHSHFRTPMFAMGNLLSFVFGSSDFVVITNNSDNPVTSIFVVFWQLSWALVLTNIFIAIMVSAFEVSKSQSSHSSYFTDLMTETVNDVWDLITPKKLGFANHRTKAEEEKKEMETRDEIKHLLSVRDTWGRLYKNGAPKDVVVEAIKRVYGDCVDDELVEDIFKLIDANKNNLISEDEWENLENLVDPFIRSRLMMYLKNNRKRIEGKMKIYFQRLEKAFEKSVEHARLFYEVAHDHPHERDDGDIPSVSMDDFEKGINIWSGRQQTSQTDLDLDGVSRGKTATVHSDSTFFRGHTHSIKTAAELPMSPFRDENLVMSFPSYFDSGDHSMM